MIKVYHTSNMRVEQPDTKHSRSELDFGPGFYFTHILTQAEKYSFRFFKRGEEAWINTYDFSEEWGNWKVKQFLKYDEEWLDFVVACRRGAIVGDFDMIVGGVADDKVFDTISLFFLNLIGKEEALRRLLYEKPNIQYFIRTDEMIKELLTFNSCTKL